MLRLPVRMLDVILGQTSTVDTKTTTQEGFFFNAKEKRTSYPFTIDYVYTFET